MRVQIVGVMGPGDGAKANDLIVAEELGRRIAEAGWAMLCGGRDGGVMAAACRGTHAVGGTSIGVLPGPTDVGASPDLTVVIRTGMGNARNAINVLSSDVVVVCGMGAGTASELALALKEGKQVILLNASRISRTFWQDLAPSQVHIAETVDEAVERIQTIIG